MAHEEEGFWIKSATYQEQPNIHFKHEYLLIVETDRIDSPVLCSTFRAFSKITNGINRCPMVKSREEDINQDGKFDELNIEIQVQLQQTDIALSVKLFLLFDYKLYKMSVFHMESLGVVQHSSSLPGARLDVVADLRLVQKQLLYSRGRDSRFNMSVFDLTRLVPDAFNLQTLFKEYARRNVAVCSLSVTTRLSNVYPLWTAGRASDMPFIVSAVVHYPEETILYRPGFWQVIKWAWVQYLSVFIIFVFIFRLIKEYVFSNQLVFTVKTVPWKKLF
uniref:Transmembrane protein 231 n=1 Tax=Timema bartmani TaxID=61472 RepID=A0A7R9ELZ5_9NEOP|nr:unnamed protein product [Timema bartmani]